MGAFLKTFVVCTILALSFIVYKNLGTDSFSNNLDLSNSNPVFSLDKSREKTEPLHTVSKQSDNIGEKTDEDKVISKNLDKKYTHICYFYSPSGKMIPVKRVIEAPLTIENSITLLLKGPLISETQKGIYSEIPPNVDLIDVKRKDNSLIVNLTSNFGNGGGSESIENRLKQLAKTVKTLEPKKNVYLYINGSEVEYLGGEGVYVKQPLE